jgi:hypothetical protein
MVSNLSGIDGALVEAWLRTPGAAIKGVLKATCLLSLSYTGLAVLNRKNKAEAQLRISSATLLKYIAFNRHEKFIRSYLDLTKILK